MPPNFIPATCVSALNCLKRENPYKWDLNIYRGCEHGCKYCYALYSHHYLQDDKDFFDNIYVKTNIVGQLEKALRTPSWKREVINIGSVCDSYQPAEANYRIMPEILKLLIKYKTPAIISTKSDLILRDYDLIDQLSRITYINVAATITVMNEDIRQKLEPGGVSSIRRFEMLRTFRRTNASVSLHVMPMVPYLTDNEENLSSLFGYGREVDVHYALPGTLNLRGKTKPYFLGFIQAEYPELFQEIFSLYKTGSLDRDYKDKLKQRVTSLLSKYKLSSNYLCLLHSKLYKERDLFSDM
jgi:DNA repair photolyase